MLLSQSKLLHTNCLFLISPCLSKPVILLYLLSSKVFKTVYKAPKNAWVQRTPRSLLSPPTKVAVRLCVCLCVYVSAPALSLAGRVCPANYNVTSAHMFQNLPLRRRLHVITMTSVDKCKNVPVRRRVHTTIVTSVNKCKNVPVNERVPGTTAASVQKC